MDSKVVCGVEKVREEMMLFEMVWLDLAIYIHYSNRILFANISLALNITEKPAEMSDIH